MSTTDKIAHGVALVVVLGFCIAMFVALLSSEETIPKEGYPIVTIALGYLLGFQVHRANGKSNAG